SGMTGGFKGAENVNKSLAQVAQEYNIPLGVGSIRAMIEKPELTHTYDVKKEYDIFLIANIGGAQLLQLPMERIIDAYNALEADALAIHLNPAQELIQKEGDLHWEGVEQKIKEIAEELPVIVKEVGSGISGEVAKRLKDSKVRYVDVAGAGGTSWTKIEYLRYQDTPAGFENWGIPTALAILQVKEYFPVWASGGIRSGIDGAKAIMLGAQVFGMAQPFLKAHTEGNLQQLMDTLIWQLKGTMFLTGSKNIEALGKAPYILLGWLKDAAQARSGLP
ncbi:MAG: type 2 isopentenyl-diphosphate Delta-isomerase, partial [Candidatus Micrarchaeota archaeon]|nr:type 2 isopentenyl-diphosphate Delta-isomerase [Candidatus Micrarchaeota archaeon]